MNIFKEGLEVLFLDKVKFLWNKQFYKDLWSLFLWLAEFLLWTFSLIISGLVAINLFMILFWVAYGDYVGPYFTVDINNGFVRLALFVGFCIACVMAHYKFKDR